MRINIMHIIVVTVLSSLAQATCEGGCLKCNTVFDNCLLCDFVSNYVLNSENTCSTKTRERCQIMSPVGECLQCAAGYYFDVVADACLEVPQPNLVANCEYYSGRSRCHTCKDGYYLAESQCLSAQYSINGCKAYASPNTCAECDIGKVLHPSGNRCVSTSSATCLFQNHLRCDACAPGYGLDYNYFVDSLFNTNTINRGGILTFITSASIKNLSYSSLSSPCRPLTIANCEDYESFNVCKKCAKNYFLADGGTSCKAFPHPAFPNCESYTYYNSCSQCVQGHLLAGPNDCQPVRPIANCAKYSQSSAANICVECASGYYINGNTCNVRQNNIDKCESYNTHEDKCSMCDASHVLTTDFLRCLPSILNCAVYQSSNKTTTSLACQTCADGYFYNTGAASCDPGEITNCGRYQNNSASTCQTCVNGHYLEGGICKPHKTINKCTVYSAIVADECTSCNNTAFLNTQNIGCALIKEDIPQCVEYASPTACNICNERYYLSNGSCLAIPAAERCLVRNNSGQCIKCENGNILSSGVCTLPLDVEIRNCLEIQNDGIASSFVCNKCKKNAFAFNYMNTYVCKLNTLGASSISNCVKYEIVAGTYTCRRCADGFYVSDSNTCVSDITSLANKALVLNYVNDITNLGGNLDMTVSSFDRYMTVGVAFQNCKHVIYANDLTQQCLTCKTGKLPIVNLVNKKTHLNPAASNPATFTPVLGYGYNTFTCVTIASPIYYPGGTANVPTNCEYFTRNISNIYCNGCKRGFTGKVETHNGNTYQNCNVAVDDCNNDVTLGGLIFEYGNNPFNFDMLVYLSCHSCYSPNKIPVMFGNKVGQLKPFSLIESDNLPTAEGTLNDVTVQCLEMIPQSFKYKHEQAIGKPVENCGVAKYNVDVTKMMHALDDFNNSPLVCAVCKSGYMPVRLDDIIVRCDPIAHCNTQSSNQWFNNCGECQIGYTWFFDPNTLAIDFSRCVSINDRNCIAALADDTDLTQISVEFPSGRCAMCKPGFTFNLDNVCEALNAPLCKIGAYVKGKYVYNNENRMYDVLNLFNKNHDGCQECESGYVSIKESNNILACTESKYIELGDFPEVSAYAENCKHYSREGTTIICRECMEGYITSASGSFCINRIVYPNCERVNNDGDKCAECQTGYVLVNESCEKPLILQCATYDTGLAYQRCISCIEGHKLVNNKCVKGQVEYCRIYDNNETCLVCNDFYLLVTLANTKQACLRINEELNCKAVFTSKLNNTQELECVTCANGYAPTSENQFFEKYVCQNIIPVDNCESYDVNVVPSQSSLRCFKCQNQYFLAQNKCIARQVTTVNCKAYSMVNDFCIECENGFYLSNEKECINYPRGIYGCIDYKDENTCTNCDKHMYLTGTTCNAVVTRITNCAYYKDDKTCSRCEFNFFLKDNTCVKAKALNCSTYSRIDRCATCAPGFGLQQVPETGVVDCLFIPHLNCRRSEHIYPFNCIECDTLFFNEHGICLAVEQSISNCDLYNSPTSCIRCQEGFILALDGKRCLDRSEAGISAYERCVDNKMTLRPQCNVCNFGEKFIKGVCTRCTNNTPTDGCMFCGGVKDEYCLICIPGYYMNKDGKCFRNSSSPSALEASDTSSR